MGSEVLAFGDCAKLIRDSINPEIINPDTPYIGLQHIAQDELRLIDIGKASDVTSNKYQFKKGDILFGKLRPYFRKVIIAPFDGVCSTDIWVVRATKKCNQLYLFYWMASPEFVNKANQGSEGTKMPRAKWDFVSQIEKEIPDLPKQEKIGNFLKSFDDKIELNQRMNETLEAIARAVFKSWFVDFDPVRAKMAGEPYPLPDEVMALFPDELVESELGMIPKGWKVSTIDEEVELVGGGTPSTKNPKYWDDGTYNFATPKDLSNLSSIYLLNTDRKVTRAGLNKISSGLLEPGTLLLSSRAPVGYLAINTIPICINQGFIAMKCNKALTTNYMLNWTKTYLEKIKSRASGTTFSELSKRNFRPMKILVPIQDIITSFEDHSSKFFDQILLNLKMNLILTYQRKSLLEYLL